MAYLILTYPIGDPFNATIIGNWKYTYCVESHVVVHRRRLLIFGQFKLGDQFIVRREDRWGFKQRNTYRNDKNIGDRQGKFQRRKDYR